jgi:hypothetical protein
MSAFGRQLEKRIKGKISGIAKGTETVKGAGVNKMIARLKVIDEAAAEELQKKYIAAVKEAAKDK